MSRCSFTSETETNPTPEKNQPYQSNQPFENYRSNPNPLKILPNPINPLKSTNPIQIHWKSYPNPTNPSKSTNPIQIQWKNQPSLFRWLPIILEKWTQRKKIRSLTYHKPRFTMGLFDAHRSGLWKKCDHSLTSFPLQICKKCKIWSATPFLHELTKTSCGWYAQKLQICDCAVHIFLKHYL